MRATAFAWPCSHGIEPVRDNMLRLIDRDDQRYEAIDRKVDVPNAVPGLGQRIGNDELDPLALRKQTAAVSRRQSSQ
jgi:hypothetical protein